MDAKSYCLLHTSPHSSVTSPAQVTSHRGCALTAHCGAQCTADTRLHQLREHPGTPLQRISRADDERSWQCLRPFGGSVWSRLEQRLAAHRSASASTRSRRTRRPPPGTQHARPSSHRARRQLDVRPRPCAGPARPARGPCKEARTTQRTRFLCRGACCVVASSGRAA